MRTYARISPSGLTRVPMRRDPNWTDLAALRALHRLPGLAAGRAAWARVERRRVCAARAVARPLRSTIRAYTPHGGSFNYQPGTALHRVYMLAEGLLARRTDLFLFESEYIAARSKAHIGAAGRLVRVVHNGISDAEFAPVVRSPDPYDLSTSASFARRRASRP